MTPVDNFTYGYPTSPLIARAQRIPTAHNSIWAALRTKRKGVVAPRHGVSRKKRVVNRQSGRRTGGVLVDEERGRCRSVEGLVGKGG